MAEVREAKQKRIPIGLIMDTGSALRKPNPKAQDYINLVDSIKVNGILNPISVREVKDPTNGETRYTVIDGLHRFYGARDAGLDSIPAQILQMSTEDVRLAQIIANVQKIETRPAAYSQQLIKILGDQPTWTEEDLAIKLSKSTKWVKDRLKINKLPDAAKALVDDKKIVLVNAYALADLMEVAEEEVPNWYDRAQTDSPAKFTPEINNRIKAIKDARRAGRAPGASDTFNPYPHLRSAGEIKNEFTKQSVAMQIVSASEAKTPVDGFAAGIAWVLRMDPVSVSQDQVAYEKKKADQKESKRVAREEADRQKNLKAANATVEATA